MNGPGLGIQRRGIKLYIIYINDDTGLTITCFTARLNFGGLCVSMDYGANCYKVI